MSTTTTYQGPRGLAEIRSGGRNEQSHAAPASAAFDLDAWHAMDQRDNALIADEIMHGTMSGKFVYDFSISGTKTTGVSVVGARHLAAHYGGIKHRIVASVEKRDALFIFTTYPAESIPMSVHVASIPEMAAEPDFYKIVVELTDVKKGVSEQHEKMEMRHEKRRDGSLYERPNFQSIAQAKAFRNGVLALIPQDVIEKFKQESLRAGNTMTVNLMDEKRTAVTRFAAQNGIALDRQALAGLTFDQMSGLGDAARAGADKFIHAATGIGLVPRVRSIPLEDDAQQSRGASKSHDEDGVVSQPNRQGKQRDPSRANDEAKAGQADDDGSAFFGDKPKPGNLPISREQAGVPTGGK
jgi:hypothetical protein